MVQRQVPAPPARLVTGHTSPEIISRLLLLLLLPAGRLKAQRPHRWAEQRLCELSAAGRGAVLLLVPPPQCEPVAIDDQAAQPQPNLGVRYPAVAACSADRPPEHKVHQARD